MKKYTKETVAIGSGMGIYSQKNAQPFIKTAQREQLFGYGYQTSIAILERGEKHFTGQFLTAIKLLEKSEEKIMINIKKQLEHGSDKK